MGEPHVISGLKSKRARIAGEIIRAQEIVSKRTQELLAIDTVLRMFSPDCDPDMIAPIRPTPRGLFFKYGELARLALAIMREGVARQALLRMVLKGHVRRILHEPDMWWELVG